LVRKEKKKKRGGGGRIERERRCWPVHVPEFFQAVCRNMLVFTAVPLSVRRHFQFRCLSAI
jgi:hypothetical protein